MLRKILKSTKESDNFFLMKDFQKAIIKGEEMLIYTVDRKGNIKCIKTELEKVKIMQSRGKIPLVAYDEKNEIKEIRIESRDIDYV